MTDRQGREGMRADDYPGLKDATSESAAIVVENLTKRFGEVTAVEGISFAVEEGSVFGFLVRTGRERRPRLGC